MNSPENFPENKARILKEIQAAAAYAKTILSPQLQSDLVEVVVAECIELRERIAERIIDKLADRGEGLSQEQLERLAWIVLYHYESSDGFIDVVEPTPKEFLRRVK